MSNSIPTPEFTPAPRPRRSSIAQGAVLSAQADTGAAPASEPSPVAASPDYSGPEESIASQPETPQSGGTVSSPPPRPRAVNGQSGGRARRGTSTAVADAPNKRMVGSKDILLSLPEDLKVRMVNTITWSHPYTGIGQQQKFIREAISDLCDRLETEFNQGKPFPEPVVRDD